MGKIKRAAAVVAAACAVGVVLWLILLKPPAPVGRADSYLLEFAFTYRGSAENLPVENIDVSSLLPHHENRVGYWPDRLRGFHALYWEDENGTLWPQTHVPNPLRAEPLRVLGHGVDLDWLKGAVVGYDLDRLYPGETFFFYRRITDEPNVLTLRVHGDDQGRSMGSFGSIHGLLEFPIDVYIWARLSRLNENGEWEAMETYARYLDNRASASAWLHPI